MVMTTRISAARSGGGRCGINSYATAATPKALVIDMRFGQAAVGDAQQTYLILPATGR